MCFFLRLLSKTSSITDIYLATKQFLCQIKLLTKYFHHDFIFIGLDQFVEPLRSTCTLKVKPNSVKQEYEKQDELKRSALRAVAALLQIPKAGMLKTFD